MAERRPSTSKSQVGTTTSYGSSTAAIADSMYRYSACSALTQATGRHGT